MSESHNSLDAFFSPHGGCTDAIVAEVNKAQREVRVLAYGFDSEPIAKALIEAKKRNVDVRIIVDRSNEHEVHTLADEIDAAGLPIYADHAHAIAHNKTMVIDRSIVITGSFNFTRNAEAANAENVLIVRDNQELALRYYDNWVKHWSHSHPYQRVNGKR